MVDVYNRWIPDFPGQTPQNDKAYINAVQRGIFPTINTYVQPAPTQQPAPAQPQAVTPPMIHADMIQIGAESETDQWPVDVGKPLMFITADDSKIIFKAMGPNGPELTVFVKQPKAPPKPAFDASAYVRKDEIDAMIDAAVSARLAAQSQRETKE